MIWDLDSLRLICWALLVAVVTITALCEGLNIGTALVLAIAVKDDAEMAALIDKIALPSLLNVCWLAMALAVVFAGWPTVFAVSVATFAPLIWLWLAGTVLRQVIWSHFSVIRQLNSWPKLRLLWRVSSVLNALIVGVIIASLLKGVSFHLDSDVRIMVLGDAWGLFNLFSGLIAAMCMAAMALYGSTFLDHLGFFSARQYILKSAVLFIGLFVLMGWWLSILEGYHISSDFVSNAASNPIGKFVKRSEGLWLDNYEHEPWLMLLPILAGLTASLAGWFSWRNQTYYAVLSSGLTVVLATITLGVTLFPFLLPSNLSLNSAMTLWDCSASYATLAVLSTLLMVTVPLMAVVTRLAHK